MEKNFLRGEMGRGWGVLSKVIHKKQHPVRRENI